MGSVRHPTVHGRPLQIQAAVASDGRQPSKKMAENTRKYLRALLCGRVVLEQALTTSKLFSPAHEVARQIQIINAYCREAELLNDPIHDALWDLLDELLEAHATVAPFSLFAESAKPSIRMTAKELMKLLPSFKERLAQREYDFILVSPMKKRMLLKMYAIGESNLLACTYCSNANSKFTS